MYTEIDLPHQPTTDPDWQESFVLIFRDPATNAAGFLRTGAYVNQGTSQVHWGMFLPDGTRFRRNQLKIPYDPTDRTERSVRSGPYMEYCIAEDHVRVTGRDTDADVDLRLYDYFPSQDWAPVGIEAPVGVRAGHSHPESSGRVEGRIRIGERVVYIENGFGHRDHSWGSRPLTVFRSARWHAGTVGPALSFSLVTSVAADGNAYKFGWVMRDGERVEIDDFHTVNMVLSDGYSTIGGYTVVKLRSGEDLRIDAEVMDGIVTSTHEVNGGPGSSPAGIEGIAIARCNGHEGVSDFNMIDNPHRGEQAVSNTLFANCDDGISRRTFDPSWLR